MEHGDLTSLQQEQCQQWVVLSYFAGRYISLRNPWAVLRERVNQASPRLPDGRLLSFTISSSSCIRASRKNIG